MEDQCENSEDDGGDADGMFIKGGRCRRQATVIVMHLNGDVWRVCGECWEMHRKELEQAGYLRVV